MWELDHKECWVLKNWCFWTVVLEKTLESPLARRSNQSILKEINPEYSLEGLLLKLKFQHFGHLMQRANSLEKTLFLGTIEGRRRREWQRISCLDGITNSIDMSLSKLQEILKDKEGWHSAVHEIAKSQTWLSNWKTTTNIPFKNFKFIYVNKYWHLDSRHPCTYRGHWHMNGHVILCWAEHFDIWGTLFYRKS